jgi:SAM-dependent methyltransferase
VVDRPDYLLAGSASERDRLTLQARVWQPAGEQLLAQLPAPPRARALDIGCGALGWLPILATWVGEEGVVIGTDVDDTSLGAAREATGGTAHGRIDLRHDDVFETVLEPAGFDLVHARFLLAPLGRWHEQLTAFRRLVRPGGVLVLEEPDSSTWRFDPPAPAAERLITLIREVFFERSDFDVGRRLPDLLRRHVAEPEHATHVVDLEPGHPYLSLPLQFASSMQAALEDLVGASELALLRDRAEAEILSPERRGSTFTLVQAWARAPVV